MCREYPGIALTNRDPLLVRPLQERNEKLTADTEPISHLGRNDGPVPAQILEHAGELLQCFPGVVAVALYRHNSPPIGR